MPLSDGDDPIPVDPDDPTLIAPPEDRPWWGPLALVAFVALVICSNIATAVWAKWVIDHPAGLLALSSRQRYLALVVPAGIGVLAYAVIGFARIAAAFVVCHLAGRAYHQDILRVFTKYLGLTPEALATYDRALDKAEFVIVPLFVGSNIVAALTGIRRTPPVRLTILLSVGIAGRLALMWWLAKVFEAPLTDVLEFLQRYQLWFIVGSIALLVGTNALNFRRGANR